MRRPDFRIVIRSVRWAAWLPALLLMTAATESMASFGFVPPAPAFGVPPPSLTDPYGRQYRFRPWHGGPGVAVAPGRYYRPGPWSRTGSMSHYRFRPAQQPRAVPAPPMTARRAAPFPPVIAMFPPRRFAYPPSYHPYAGMPFMPRPIMPPGYGFPAALPVVAFVPPWHRNGIVGPGVFPPARQMPVPGYAAPFPYGAPPPALANAPVRGQPAWAQGGYRFRPQQLSASRHLFRYQGRTWRFRPLEQSVTNDRQPSAQGSPVSVMTGLPSVQGHPVSLPNPGVPAQVAGISEVPNRVHLAGITARIVVAVPVEVNANNKTAIRFADATPTASEGSHPVTPLSGADPPLRWNASRRYAGWKHKLVRHHPV